MPACFNYNGSIKTSKDAVDKNVPMREEFRLLQEHFEWILSRLPSGLIITKKKLMAIRDHIKLCDHIAQNSYEKTMTKRIKCAWDMAVKIVLGEQETLEFFSPKLSESKPPLVIRGHQVTLRSEDTELEIPEEPYSLSYTDREFLKSLKISRDELSPESDRNEDGY